MTKSSLKAIISKVDISDILAWTSLLILFLWALGKSFGIIHSPNWVEMIPTFTGVGAVAAILLKFGEYRNILMTVNIELKEVKHDIKEIHKSASCMKGKCAEYVI